MIADLRSAVLDSGIPIRLMTVSNTGGWRNFASTDAQIRTPADIKGRKFRTISAPVQQELVRQLGGNPTPVAWSEVYTALATGVVEGTKNGIQDIVGMKLHEQIKFITLDGHSYMGGLWWYSEVSWQALPPDLQRIVYDGFQELKTVTRGIIKRREIDADLCTCRHPMRRKCSVMRLAACAPGTSSSTEVSGSTSSTGQSETAKCRSILPTKKP